jgi:hypothetical protein
MNRRRLVAVVLFIIGRFRGAGNSHEAPGLAFAFVRGGSTIRPFRPTSPGDCVATPEVRKSRPGYSPAVTEMPINTGRIRDREHVSAGGSANLQKPRLGRRVLQVRTVERLGIEEDGDWRVTIRWGRQSFHTTGTRESDRYAQ